MRKAVLKLIQEVVGVVVPLSISTKNIFNRISEQLSKIDVRKNIIPEILDFYRVEDEFDYKTMPIAAITTRVIFINRIEDEIKNEVQGKYISKEIHQYSNEYGIYYTVEVNLFIKNWDSKSSLEKEIKSTLSHELHHAYDAVMRFNKKSITRILNTTKNILSTLYANEFKNYPQFKNFMNIFYINLPEERNARIHQLFEEMQGIKDQNVDEIIVELSKFYPYKDFKKMGDYNALEFSDVPTELKTRFVELFHTILQKNKEKFKLEDNEISYPKTPDGFFDFWESQFHKNAEVMRKKVIKLVKNIKNINISEEFDVVNEVGMTALESLYGFGADDYDFRF